MSAKTETDSRVVEMVFDNKQFESASRETLSTIEKLKQSLFFKEQEQSIDSFENTSVKALDTVKVQFSALEIAAVSALNNIVNKAVDSGVALVKSLSVDNIASGWTRFDEMTRHSGTLVSQGYSMEVVEDQLERLNWYTDETSYNFADMVSNISKFTASGKDLEDSVTAMMGIANWAALSGQNASVASRAMYQLSQAMGSGTMRLMDWRSIQNASMDTDEFRQIALDTAVAMGRLKKNADGTYQSLVGSGKEGTKAFKKSQFADSLTQGLWFDSDVMMAVYGKYGSAIDKVREYAEENGLTASEAMSDLEDELDAFGLKALRAAQEARTFGDALDATKDAVSTGFMKTFQNIFGNYAEAKTLWTQLANELYDVFAESGNERNEILKEWKNMGGRMDFLQALWNGFHNLVNILYAVKEGFKEVFPPATAEQLHSITENIKALSEKLYLNSVHLEVVKTAAKGIFSVFDMIITAFRSVLRGLEPIIGPVEDLGYYIEAVIYKFSSMLIKMDENAKEFGLFQTITDTVSAAVQFLLSLLSKLLSLDIPGFLSGAVQAGAAVVSIVIGIAHSIADVFSDVTGIDISAPIERAQSAVTQFSQHIRTDFFGTIESIKQKISEFIASIKVTISAKLSDIFGKLPELKNLDAITFFKTLFSTIAVIIQAINAGSLFMIANGIDGLVKSIVRINKSVTECIDSVRECFEAYQQRIKAKVLKTIAVSIGIFTASLIALSKLDTEGLATGLIALSMELIGLMVAMTKIAGIAVGTKHLKNLKVTVDYLLSMSASVVLLSYAMKQIAGIKIEDMITAVLGIDAMLYSLAVVAAELSTNTSLIIKGASSFILLAAAVNTMVPSVVELSGLGWENALQGFATVFGLMSGLVIMLVGAGEVLKSLPGVEASVLAAGAAMILIGASVNTLVPPLLTLGAVDVEVVKQGILALTIILGELSVFSAIVGTVNPAAAVGTLIAFGAALHIIIPPLLAFGEMDWDKFAYSAGSMAIMLAELAVFSLVLRKSNFAGGAGTLIAFGAALNMLIPPILILGSIKIETAGQALEILSIMLIELTAFLFAAQSVPTAGGAVTILALAASIGVLGAVLTAMGARAITIMVVALILPVIIKFASAISMLGPGLSAAIPKLVGLSASFALLGLGASLLVPAMVGLASSVPIWVAGIQALADTAPQLRESLTIIGGEFILWMEDMLPLITRVVSEIVLGLLLGILQALNTYLAPILEQVIEILIDAIVVLGNKLMPLFDALVDLIVDVVVEVLEKVADVIIHDGGRILAACLHVVDALYILIAELFGANGDELKQWLEDGREQLKEWADGFSGAIGIVIAAVGAFAVALSGLAPVPAVIAVAILGLIAVIMVFKDQIVGVYNYAVQYTQNGIAAIVGYFTGLWNDMKEIGAWIIDGFIEGLEKGKENVVSTVKNIGNGVVGWFEKIFHIDSPSKVMSDIGGYLDSGLVTGMKNGQKDIYKNTEKIGNNLLETMRNTLGTHSDSDETIDMGEDVDGGLYTGMKDSAGKVFEYVKGFGSDILSLFGVDLNFDNFFGIGQNSMLGLGEGMSDAAKEIYKKASLRSGIAGEKNFAENMNKQLEARAKAERLANLQRMAANGVTLNSEDKKFLADSLVEKLDPDASVESIAETLRLSDLFDIKDIQEYVEELKKADQTAKDTNQTLGDQAGAGEEAAANWEELSKRVSEAKSAYDKIYNAWQEGYISYEEYQKLYADLLKEYSDVRPYLEKYVNEKLEKLRKDAYDKELKEAKEHYDELYDLWQNGDIDRAEYEKRYADLVSKYALVRVDLEQYVNEKLEKLHEQNVKDAKEAYNDILERYKDGTIKREEYEKEFTELLAKYVDEQVDITEYAYEQITSYTESSLQTITKAYEDTLSDIQDSADDLAKSLRSGMGDAFEFVTAADAKAPVEELKSAYTDAINDIYSDQNSFAEKMGTSFEDSFEFKTNKDVYDETVNDYSDRIDKLNEKLEKSNEVYGENSLQSQYYRREIDKLTKSLEKYKQEYADSGKEDDEIAEVSFGEKLKKDTEELKDYNEKIGKLVDRGVDTDILDKIREMDRKTGLATIEYLLGLSDSEYKNTIDTWRENQLLAAEAAGTAYAQDTADMNNAFMKGYLSWRKESEYGDVSNLPDDTYVSANLKAEFDKETAELEEYTNLFKVMEKRGYFNPDTYAGEEFRNYLLQLPRQQAVILMKEMSKWKKSERDDFMESFGAMVEASNDAADTAYRGEIKKATQQYETDITELIDELPDSAKEAGKKCVLNLAEGFSEGTEESLLKINSSIDELTASIEDSVGISELSNNAKLAGKLVDVGTQLKDSFVDSFNLSDAEIFKMGSDILNAIDIVSRQTDGRLTITPVLDMSTINSQAAAVSGTVQSAAVSAGLASDISTSETIRVEQNAASYSSLQYALTETNGLLREIRASASDIYLGVGRNTSSIVTAIDEKQLMFDANSLASGLAAPLNLTIGRLIAQKGRA